MRIAFVGLEKDFAQIPPDYVEKFVQYHLEIPWYYAQAGNEVYITTPSRFDWRHDFLPDIDSNVRVAVLPELNYRIVFSRPFMVEDGQLDVVIHWRKWREDLYMPGAINLLHTCDHTYGEDWKKNVRDAFNEGKLYGILCYRSWHRRNMELETGLPTERFFTDCTLGVDTDIYHPVPEKDPYQMLWSSDPGRGLAGAIELAVKMFSFDKRYRLNICYPDYVRPPSRAQHPALVWHGNVSNGPKLWSLFNRCGVLPYTSTFKEPSSRAHRQAQAAGSLVLYPPDMGSPSELIQHEVTGIVAPISQWSGILLELVRTGLWSEYGVNARRFAEQQTWKIQAENFNTLIREIKEGKR